MNFLRAQKDRWVFQLTAGEQAVLLDLLKLYPCVPAAHHRLSRGEATEKDAENQRLLDEALAEQRAWKKRQLQRLIRRPSTFKADGDRWQFTLRRGDFEWLIQVLNDIRVGSWLALGSPEELPRLFVTQDASTPLTFAMELAGLFQMTLLEAIEGDAGLES